MASTKNQSYTTSGSNTSSRNTYGSVTQGHSVSQSRGGSHTVSNTHTEGGSSSHTHTEERGGGTSITSSRTTGGGSSTTRSVTNGGGTSHTRSVTGYTGKVSDTTQRNFDAANLPYQESGTVQEAYHNLQNTLHNKPGAFSSSFTDELNNIYNTIKGRDPYSYNLNTDALYQQYRQQYTNLGKQAMQDTQAQASALTGGYGNSYATTAGSQAYQNYLQQLNDRVPELEQRAFERYQAEGNRLQQNFENAGTMYSRDYQKWRADVEDWQNDRSFAASQYQNERNFDYNKFNDNRNYWQNEYWNERKAEQTTESNTDYTNWSTTDSKTDYSTWSQTDSRTDTSTWKNTDSQTDTKHWEDSNTTTDSTNWNDTVTNSTSATSGWSNTDTGTTGWQRTNSSSDSGSYGGTSRSGGKSGSSGGTHGFNFKSTTGRSGGGLVDANGANNGSTSANNLSKWMRNSSVGEREMLANNLRQKTPDQQETQLKKWSTNGVGGNSKRKVNETDAEYLLWLANGKK